MGPRKNTFTFHTMLYTRHAYELVRRALQYEFLSNASAFLYKRSVYPPWGHAYVFGYNDSIDQNFVTLADDGEVVFNYTVPDYFQEQAITPDEFVRMLNVFIGSDKFRTLELAKVDDIADGVSMIEKVLHGEVSEEDCASSIYRKFVGFPIDPFKAELLRVKRKAFDEELDRLALLVHNFGESPSLLRNSSLLDSFGVPNDFMPGSCTRLDCWVNKVIDEKFSELINVIA